MTFVGKILVILIMALSLVFLGVSTVVFTTATNWKEETAKQTKKVNELRTQLDNAKATEAGVQGKFEEAKKDNEAATKKYDEQVAALKADNDRAQAEITAARTALTDAQANAKIALEEASARAGDAGKIREQLTAVVDQSNKFKIQQTELNNEILNLTRMLDAARRNEKSLRETTWKYVSLLREKGISTDVKDRVASEPAPNVEGKVLKVDARNRNMEISIGSDDGLSKGQELFLFRTATSEFLGKVKIGEVDHDQAVATVIGATVNGKKIKEGDDVASSIR